MSLWSKIAVQFGHPTGLLGRLAGFIMANRSSNVERIHWGVSLLDLQPADRVLEIGYGPGVGIQKISETVTDGVIWGIDHSALMLKQASKRNQGAVASGKVKLLQNPVSDLPSFGEPLDKILDVNTFQFWKNPVEDLKSLKEQMRPGGIIALVQQPRKPGATEEDTVKAGEKYAEQLRAAGFSEIETEMKKLKPVSAVCVIGKK
jgi:trans-aconitate methyltransferase